MAIGTCSRCGRRTRSMSFKYCTACAKRLGVCQMCGRRSDKPLCDECSGRPILH